MDEFVFECGVGDDIWKSRLVSQKEHSQCPPKAFAFHRVWSNGRLRNVQHRAMCKEATLRFSIATFIAPPKDMVLEALAVFVDAQYPRLYSAITYEKFRKIRASKNMHACEALSMVLKILPLKSPYMLF
ncbi:2-oxoglutarate-dependent dioxygenase DAO-like protein [Drosera capensis]